MSKDLIEDKIDENIKKITNSNSLSFNAINRDKSLYSVTNSLW
jgi:hypothetical protein